MIDEAGGRVLRSLWRLRGPCLSTSTSLLSSRRSPPRLWCLICLLSKHSLVYSPPTASPPLPSFMTHHLPFSPCLLCGLIDGRTLTSCPPSISPPCPGPEGPLALSLSCCPSPHPAPPPAPFTALFIIHYVSLWIQREQKHGWIHRQTQQFAQGYVSNVNVCACMDGGMVEEREVERERLTDRLTNWLTETKGGGETKREGKSRVRAPCWKRVQNSVIGLFWNQEKSVCPSWECTARLRIQRDWDYEWLWRLMFCGRLDNCVIWLFTQSRHYASDSEQISALTLISLLAMPSFVPACHQNIICLFTCSQFEQWRFSHDVTSRKQGVWGCVHFTGNLLPNKIFPSLWDNCKIICTHSSVVHNNGSKCDTQVPNTGSILFKVFNRSVTSSFTPQFQNVEMRSPYFLNLLIFCCFGGFSLPRP